MTRWQNINAVVYDKVRKPGWQLGQARIGVLKRQELLPVKDKILMRFIKRYSNLSGL